MSERSRNLPRRSCLSTPGSSDRFLAKAPTAVADMTFLDLEDSVAPNEKVAARAKIVNAVRTQDWGERVLCVRVNAWDTQWTYGDVIEVVGNAGIRLDEVMLPKVQCAAEVVAMDLLLTQVEKNAGLPIGHIGIEAQIETARGLINVDDICAASPRLETIIFGPADFAASIEMPVLTGGVAIPEYPGDHFNYVFSRILMAGRANGLQVIDGPFLKVRELDALREFSQRTRMLGYDGKWALNPRPGPGTQRRLLADPGTVRQGVGHPRGLPRGHRGEQRGCRDVRRRNDRRGVAQDGHEVPDQGNARRSDPLAAVTLVLLGDHPIKVAKWPR
jgi:citrate lyase subunit beta/citryl-CoA lyase